MKKILDGSFIVQPLNMSFILKTKICMYFLKPHKYNRNLKIDNTYICSILNKNRINILSKSYYLNVSILHHNLFFTKCQKKELKQQKYKYGSLPGP